MPTFEQIEPGVGVAESAADRDDVTGARAVTSYHRPRAIAKRGNGDDELLPRAQIATNDAGASLARAVPQASDNVKEHVGVHVTRRDHRSDQS